MRMLLVEVRRAWHRRVTWALIAMALLGSAVAGLIAFFDSADLNVAAMAERGEHHPAVMTDWWLEGGGDGLLLVAAFFLLMGGLIGGASFVGGEWRAATVTTLLTWEPRRLRLHAARTAAAAGCAAVVAFVLQSVFLSAFLPAVLAHGTTAGADAEWVVSLVSAMGRISVLTALATVIGVSLACVTRNTAAAIVAGGAWMAIGENLVRNFRPGLTRFLLGENLTLVLTWADLEPVRFSRPPAFALATLVAYAATTAVVAAVRFRHSDIAAA